MDDLSSADREAEWQLDVKHVSRGAALRHEMMSPAWPSPCGAHSLTCNVSPLFPLIHKLHILMTRKTRRRTKSQSTDPKAPEDKGTHYKLVMCSESLLTFLFKEVRQQVAHGMSILGSECNVGGPGINVVAEEADHKSQAGSSTQSQAHKKDLDGSSNTDDHSTVVPSKFGTAGDRAPDDTAQRTSSEIPEQLGTLMAMPMRCGLFIWVKHRAMTKPALIA